MYDSVHMHNLFLFPVSSSIPSILIHLLCTLQYLKAWITVCHVGQILHLCQNYYTSMWYKKHTRTQVRHCTPVQVIDILCGIFLKSFYIFLDPWLIFFFSYLRIADVQILVIQEVIVSRLAAYFFYSCSWYYCKHHQISEMVSTLKFYKLENIPKDYYFFPFLSAVHSYPRGHSDIKQNFISFCNEYY